MSKNLILSKLEEFGFTLENIDEFGYFFKFEELSILYLPDKDDKNFIRFAVPSIFDVTAENRILVLEVVNETNMTVKYSKTYVSGENVWAFYEYQLFGNEHIEDILEFGIRLLQVTVNFFHRKIEGDDNFPGICVKDNELTK